MSFRPAIVVSSSQINFQCALLHQQPARVKMRIDKDKWTTVASQNDIHSSLVLAEKGKLWTSTLSHKMCPRKQTTEPKLLILVSFFSEEDTSSMQHPRLEVRIFFFFFYSELDQLFL